MSSYVVRVDNPKMLGTLMPYCGGDGFACSVKWSDGSVTAEFDGTIRDATVLEIMAAQDDASPGSDGE